MERNLAALRLQELYRKRQDQREKEEREMMNLKQPAVKQVFRGHRNARTMVRPALVRISFDRWGRFSSGCGTIAALRKELPSQLPTNSHRLERNYFDASAP